MYYLAYLFDLISQFHLLLSAFFSIICVNQFCRKRWLQWDDTQYNTTKGFYRHSSPNDNYEYTFQAKDIRESGEGATAKFKLRLSDYTYDTNDFAFLSLNFTKEGNSEGVNGSYAHQKVSITFSPSFSIDRVGKISLSGGFNIVSYYVQDTGYVSINW